MEDRRKNKYVIMSRELQDEMCIFVHMDRLIVRGLEEKVIIIHYSQLKRLGDLQKN